MLSRIVLRHIRLQEHWGVRLPQKLVNFIHGSLTNMNHTRVESRHLGNVKRGRCKRGPDVLRSDLNPVAISRPKCAFAAVLHPKRNDPFYTDPFYIPYKAAGRLRSLRPGGVALAAGRAAPGRGGYTQDQLQKLPHYAPNLQLLSASLPSKASTRYATRKR